MRLSTALDIGKHEVVSLVGGGGKTTLMFTLARELARDRACVVTTTTTKMRESEPSLYGSSLLILENQENRLIELVEANLTGSGYTTVVLEKLYGLGKLKGISPMAVDKLSMLSSISCVLVEADGAAQRSLKAPNTTEPLIPQSTTLVIPIVGIDSLGLQLTEKNVFRSDIASRLTGLEQGDIVTLDAIATLITHPEGLTKGSPATTRIIPFINKMDLANAWSRGQSLAVAILEKKHRQIKRVILGRAQAASPVVRVISVSE